MVGPGTATGSTGPSPPSTNSAAPEPEAPRRGGWRTFWNVVLGIDLAAIGLMLLLGIVTMAVLNLAPDSDTAHRLEDGLGEVSERDLWVNSSLSFLMFAAVPFAWVLGTRTRPWEGAKRYLRLGPLLPNLGRGLLLGAGLLASVMVAILLYYAATGGIDRLTETSKDDEVPALLREMTWPLAIAVSVGAGVGEELFFRGLLQRRLGMWGQAALFGLAHAGGGVLLQVGVTFAIGLLFGYLYRRGWTLGSLMVAHASYDFMYLAIGLSARG
ncbi:MAG TPA: CPBP family intramembrane glutamic endopeptidase [Candidatus Thermoplasmatota archaeon]|nr:CPBP family intramembrane glutamic endopeptidase [Candidatus Thermoplasmatota archaeon]